MPKVLNKRRDKIPEGSVYIGRGSKWGNPFRIGRDGMRKEVIEKHWDFLRERPDLIAGARRELKGKNLVCFCKPLA